MKPNQHPVMLGLGAVAGCLLAATFLPAAVASADQYDFTPDPVTFDPTQVEGYPPLINEVTGAEEWNIYDVTTGSSGQYADLLSGVDTETTIGSFTNDDFLFGSRGQIIGIGAANSVNDVLITGDSEIDVANFGGGFANEWVDILDSGSPDSGISDLLITPFGDSPSSARSSQTSPPRSNNCQPLSHMERRFVLAPQRVSCWHSSATKSIDAQWILQSSQRLRLHGATEKCT